MNLSRKWLNEFVDDVSVSDINDREFAEAMTLSGSKVETFEDLGKEISNIVVGKVLSMSKHPNSDHMWLCMVDVGQAEPVQIVTGAWNVHVGDLVPVALDNSTLPGGKTITKGTLRGEVSDGMLCGLYELGLDERDFPYAAIKAAAILGNYHPLDKNKPSIPADIQAGDKVFGPVVAAKVVSVEVSGVNEYDCVLDLGGSEVSCHTDCHNIHEGDMLAYNTKSGTVCTLADLHAEQAEFPNCIPDGIFILHEDGIKPGDDIKPIIGADDHVVEFEITPNRPDCLSVIGLAREAAATFGKELKLHTPVVKGSADGKLDDLLKVEVPAADLCPRYTARMVRNVKIAPSPKWMRERLRAMGVRPINNIVDITNYVMMEYGQPMHAFDYRYVKGGKIIVRRAEDGETLTTLDGNLRKLNSSMLVIADDTRAVGLAGIMGGENSEIVDDTVDVVFESANFDGTCIRKGALALGMRTEASAKFEKGLDAYNTLPAVDRACELVELLGAGEVVDGVIDVVNHLPEPTVLDLRPDKINALLGTNVETAEMLRILKSLQFGVDGETITVPSWRGDVVHYSDLSEEVARFFGYNNIPCTLVRGETTRGGYNAEQLLEQQLGSLCRAVGYDEIITYSFISPTYYDKIRWATDDPRRESFKILNPLGEDTSIMRTTTLPSMLEILTRNYNFRNKAVKLYEIGRTYGLGGKDGLAIESKFLTLGTYGAGTTFFTLKGVIETVLTDIRAEGVRYEACTDNPSYHPGRCAKVYCGDEYIGVFGQIHPLVAQNYGIDAELYCAELSLDALMKSRGADPVYTPLPRFPAVSRDIAVVCDKKIPVAHLIDCIMKNGGEYLKNCTLFDIYTGSHIADGMKSVAFSLTMRADDQTLTDEHAEETMNAVLAALESKFGAKMR